MILNKKCYFIKGYKNAAIYDLTNCKVYSVNEYGKLAIEKCLNNRKLSKMEEEYICKLEKMKLLTNEINEWDNEIAMPKARLRYAWLELTETCNLCCIHCYGQFGVPNINKKDQLSLTDWKRVIDNLILNGCKEIQLIGGEPMVHKDFYKILQYAHKSGMERIDVFTNGTLINENSIKIFKDTNANVRVSVYGHNSEIHDKITGKKGSFIKTDKALKLLHDNNIKTSIAIIIMKENEEYIEQIKNYIKDTKHTYNGYDVIRPSCMSDGKDHSISNIEVLKTRYNVKPEFWINEEKFIESNFYNSCWNGKIAITAKGDIIPCIFARDEIIGNIKTDSPQNIENNIIKKWQITKDNIEICKDCEYRYCCHDCRPIAKGIEGRIDAKYPRCCYDPYKGEWLDINSVTKEIRKM